MSFSKKLPEKLRINFAWPKKSPLSFLFCNIYATTITKISGDLQVCLCSSDVVDSLILLIRHCQTCCLNKSILCMSPDTHAFGGGGEAGYARLALALHLQRKHVASEINGAL